MPNKFQRTATYKPEEVLPFLPILSQLPAGTRLHTVRKDFDGDMIKICSDRYYTFQKSLCCSHCGIEGKFFGKERHIDKSGFPLSNSFHLNLYAINEQGQEILMTKDHIVPKSKGGKDKLSNYQTMCEICNSAKSSLNEDKAIIAAKKRLEASS